MRLTFAETIIAAEPDYGGFDAVEGFEPSDAPVAEWSEPLRAVNAVPLCFGNVKTTVTGTILPPPEDTVGAALKAAAKLYASTSRKWLAANRVGWRDPNISMPRP
jgi:hypothetical protein